MNRQLSKINLPLDAKAGFEAPLIDKLRKQDSDIIDQINSQVQGVGTPLSLGSDSFSNQCDSSRHGYSSSQQDRAAAELHRRRDPDRGRWILDGHWWQHRYRCVGSRWSRNPIHQ